MEKTTGETTGRDQETPAELQPIRDLVNTLDVEAGVEALTEPSVLRDWLVERELLDPGSPVSAADLAATIELREALRAMLRVNDGHPVDTRAVEIVNRAARELPLQLRFSANGEPALGPRPDGARGALATLLAAIALANAHGTWSRLKVCSSDTCQWAFYDRSKNRSGRWCSMRVCGNRTKTRAYRARQRD
jgi:predicted RNA-binding Zn ribbon-like protein